MSDRPTASSPAPPRHEPVRVAAETWVIQATVGEGVAPQAIHMNSMVIRGKEPVVIDTGCAMHRDTYLEDLFAIVEPDDVRWVFLTHDDPDHHGNVEQVMAACPNATFVSTWFLCERLTAEGFPVPPTRWRWVGDGEPLDIGDRVLQAVRPPLYDSPTTRGLFDPATGVYYASDCYAAPVVTGTPFAHDLDRDDWAEGFLAFNAWNSPWVSLVDEGAFGQECRRVESLEPTAIVSTHGPAIVGDSLATAFELTRSLPVAAVPPQPDQSVLEHLLAATRPTTAGPA